MMRSEQYYTCISTIRSLKEDLTKPDGNLDLIHVLLFDKFKLLMNDYQRYIGQDESHEVDLILFHKILGESLEGNMGRTNRHTYLLNHL